jgi:hypothetical protein
MFGALHVALGALVLSFAQTPAKQESMSFSLKTGEVCSGLSQEECCAQMLDFAGFKAQGDHLPRLVRSSVKLACAQSRESLSDHVCRSIMTTRGFSIEDADAACAPAKLSGRCQRDKDCTRCTDDLEKLSYRGGQHACYAVTHRPEAKNTGQVSVKKVFVIGKNGKVTTELRFKKD